MKTLIYFFAIAMILFAGCAKDEIFSDVQNSSELKKAKVPIPMKGEICMVGNEEDRLTVHFGSPDGPVITGIDLSRTAWLYGNMTHVGKLGDESFMTGRDGAYLDSEAYSKGKKVIVATYHARIFAANGDYFELYSDIRIDATDPDNKIITGSYRVNGGTGKYENIKGEGILSGVLPCWNTEGIIEYIK